MILMYHHEVILSPNSFLFGDYFDGLKNYYTPLYHILFDESYSRFGGMNYPNGEQIVFADAQPLISAIIKFISTNIVDISSYTVGILNFLMFLNTKHKKGIYQIFNWTDFIGLYTAWTYFLMPKSTMKLNLFVISPGTFSNLFRQKI